MSKNGWMPILMNMELPVHKLEQIMILTFSQY